MSRGYCKNTAVGILYPIMGSILMYDKVLMGIVKEDSMIAYRHA